MTIFSGKLARLRTQSALTVLQFLIGAVAIGLIFWQLQFSTNAICCGDFDGYYHVKWSQMLWESIKVGKFPPLFPWLPLTTLNARDYVDHHLLFHIIQMPFVVFSDPRMGAKIASALFGGLAILSCYWLVLRHRIRYPLVWLIALLACSQPFLFRMNMAKAPPFAIIFLVIAIHLFFQKKYWQLLPLALVFTWTYDLFVLLIMATVFWVIAVAVTEQRFEWRPLVYVALGCAAGLVINPYFPHNFQLLVEHVRIKVTASDFDTTVGQEWYPDDSWAFLRNSAVACGAMLVGYLALEPSERKRAVKQVFLLLLATTLMIMTARWRRIAEYWPPFAILFAAFSLQPWLAGFRPYLTRLPPDVMEELKPYFDRDDRAKPERESGAWEILKMAAVVSVALALSVFLFFNLRATVNDLERGRDHNYYKKGAEWMRSNVPAGQLIFNTDWDDFPRLFYFDPSHYYISGLDPNYLFDHDPDLSRIYERVSLGNEEDPARLIRERFGARYVFSDNKHHDFFEQARSSGWFDIIYEDTDCVIMYIRDEPVFDNPLDAP